VKNTIPKAYRRGKWPPVLIALLSIVVIACGTAAPPTQPPPTAAPAPADTQAPAETMAPAENPTATPIPVVQPTPRPADVEASRDDVVIVLTQEPDDPNIFTATTLFPNNIGHNVAQPFSFFGPDFVDTATGGFQSFEIMEPNRWRLHLTPGVKFHNGEDWNAEAAKWNIDFMGKVENATQTYSNVGDSHGEVVDDLTVDFVCDGETCPMLHRFAQYTVFQAPEWYQSFSDEERDARGEIVGWGPYKFKQWNRGESYIIERYEDYVDPGNRFIAQAGSVQEATYVWRPEALVRVAMVQTGEADLAFNLGANELPELENHPRAKWVRANNGEVITLNNDQIWDPFIKQLPFRQALAHAINCPDLAAAIYGPQSQCRSGPGVPGVLGVTEENTKPYYTYDPEEARQLLEETGYYATGNNLQSRHEINLWTRDGRTPNDVEIAEGIVSFWQEVGVNAKLNVVEPSIWNDRHLTGPNRIIEAGGTLQDIATSAPPPPMNASPGIVFFAPGGELFDFGRQLNFYADCYSNRSKNCDLERQDLVERAVAAGGEERQMLMEQAYEDFARNLLHIPLFDVIGIWGVNQDLEFVDMPGGRRILVNTMTWTQ
jgi:peptide/nickel transport system substrate-binding protein